MNIASSCRPAVAFATHAMNRTDFMVDCSPAMTNPPPDPRSLAVTASRPPEPATGVDTPDRSEATRSPGRRWRRRLLWATLVLGLSIAVIGAVSSLLTWNSWRNVERVELSDVLTNSIDGTNYLIVGTDSRDGIDADQPNAGAIIGSVVSGERTDSIAILHFGEGGARLLAIPRDLYLPLDGGSTNRINAAFYFGGPRSLVSTIQSQLGIGIDHYLQVDLAGFLGLVDALGGVTIDIPNPAYDLGSGLRLETSGPTLLDGDTALAYVRSRHLVEIIDGKEVRDPTSDLGRVQRQQKFLAAVFRQMGATYNPFTLFGVVRGVTSNVKVDDAMTFRDAASLGLRLRGLNPDSSTLPTRPFTTDSGAQVLLLRTDEAEVMLAEFR